MNATSTRADEIADYLAGVRAALADLPAAARDELLDDLPDHLAEVVADSEEPLTQRLGEPAAYAAELRAAAGVVPGSRGAGGPSLWERSGRRARAVDGKLGPLLGYPRVSDFVRLLRPAWWLARGYVLAMVLLQLLGVRGNGLLPRVGNNPVGGVVFALACMTASIWLGRRVEQAGGWTKLPARGNFVGGLPRLTLIAANVLIVLCSVGLLLGMDGRLGNNGSVAYDGGPTDNVQDLYPYGSDGQPLHGVRLYDQNGNEVQVGDAYRCSNQPRVYIVPHSTAYVDGSGDPRFAYPLCGAAPYASVAPLGAPIAPAPSPSPLPSGGTSPAPGTASAGPAGSPSASASPTG